MIDFKNCFFYAFIPVFMFMSCNQGNENEINSILTNSNPFQTLIDSVVINNDSVVGIILHVESPDLKISWTGVRGTDEIGSNSDLTQNQPFRIASITKTYVAVAILRLLEEGKLSLNDSIGKYLSKTHLNILHKDSYSTKMITIRNLLNHTHGIFDYAMSDLYFKKINEEPNHWWTRTEQLKIAIHDGGPQGNPGERFYYSDTGYILLGEIIESITGKSLAESLRELIRFRQLGVNSTWIESVEENPAGILDIVHPYYKGKDFYNISPSIDLYGGGGLVSTASDISVFYQSLFENKVFKLRTTLDTMLTKTVFANGYIPTQDYRIGIQVSEINGVEIYYHTGIWGSLVAYIPDLKTSLAINFTKNYDPIILVQSLSILQQLKITKHNST